MKKTRSYHHGLTRFFTKGVTASYVAESLASFDAATPAPDVARIAEENGYRIVGIREEGTIVGWAYRDALGAGPCGKYKDAFRSDQVLDENAPLARVIEVLDEKDAVFVSLLGTVGGIITRTDLRKPAVRMWLFGLVSIIEMSLTQIILSRLPGDGWKEYLSEGRLRKAEQLMLERERMKPMTRLQLVDCLQFSDKADIAGKIPELRASLGLESRQVARKTYRDLESLRNNLAHSQDIISENWEVIANLSGQVERILETEAL